MIPYVVAAAVGALLVSRNSPKTKLQKMKTMGPRSGLTYDVDLVPGLGVVILHSPDGTARAVFQKNPPPKPGFTFVQGAGRPEIIEAMKQDLT